MNASEEIIMKTPKSVKINAQSQIAIVKTNSGSGLAIEGDLNYKSNNVILEGIVKEAFADFDDDEPKIGQKPEPPKEMPLWEKIAIAAVAVVAAAVVLAPEVTMVALGASFNLGTAIAVCAGVGATVSAVADAGTQWLTNGHKVSEIDPLEVIISASGGTISGAFAVLPISRLGEAGINGVIGAVQSASTGGSVADIASGFALGAIAGFAGGAGYKATWRLFYDANHVNSALNASKRGFEAGVVVPWIGKAANYIGDKLEEWFDKKSEGNLIC
ncbi:hypothetical protein [Clostridium beijerinckii]|uniref:hypothetical protein n=1 Tax=Clostridium beijerinckii TaxID=1520 RepID=UPI00156FF630|nr:hypothetical protein [Clostridium beijerinckii]NRT72212.1 hypothetical protein [Clostridium beijerinckii]